MSGCFEASRHVNCCGLIVGASGKTSCTEYMQTMESKNVITNYF